MADTTVSARRKYTSQSPARTWNFGTRTILRQAAEDAQRHLGLLEFLMPLSLMEIEALAAEEDSGEEET